MECLDANGIQDLMSGALDGTARALAVKHLDGCEDCRGLISLLARDATRTAALETLHPNKATPIGACVTDPEQFEALLAAGTGSAPFHD